MPLYIYRCISCNKKLEIEQKITDSILTECGDYCREPYSDSGGPNGGILKRVIQPVSTIFKGSGFYETDYKKK